MTELFFKTFEIIFSLFPYVINSKINLCISFLKFLLNRCHIFRLFFMFFFHHTASKNQSWIKI